MFVAGLVAGIVNAAVGSGTLFTFATLLALGVPPVAANATNCLGLVAGSASGAWAFRDLMGRELIRWSMIVAVTAMAGALFVLVLPSSVFAAAVPWLILGAVVLVGLQPLIAKHLPDPHPHVSGLAMAGSGFYGGYFGASQGIAYLAALGLAGVKSLHTANGYKNALAGVAGVCASIVFIAGGKVVWWAVLVLSVSSLLGGWIGGRLTRRLPVVALRVLVVVVGVLAAGIAFSKVT